MRGKPIKWEKNSNRMIWQRMNVAIRRVQQNTEKDGDRDG